MVIIKAYYTHGETLYIYINKIKERTLNIIVHRSCLVSNFVSNENTLNEPLKLEIKADGKTIFSDNLTNNDIIQQLNYCTESKCSYTSKRPPKIEVLVNDKTYRTYEPAEIENRFYEGNVLEMLFQEHGAG